MAPRRAAVMLGAGLGALAIALWMASSARGRVAAQPVYSVAQVLAGWAHHPAMWAGRTVLVHGRLVGICDDTYGSGPLTAQLCPRMLAPDAQGETQVTVRRSSYGPHMAYVSVLGAVLSLDSGPVPAPNPFIAALARLPILAGRASWSDDQFVQVGVYRVKVGDNRGARCVREAVCYDAQLLARQ